jgi:ArsR family metal-binding transcriptional regulator
VKIYDHPLNSNVTIIEINKIDNTYNFLNSIIDGFKIHGDVYPSSSYYNEKKVIYLNGQKQNIDNLDTFGEITIQMIQMSMPNADAEAIAMKSINLATESGYTELAEHLDMLPIKQFEILKIAS